ncbi:helix-turn-helix domain-containing protein [Nocardioides cheoyonin]|uniref:helix-turn-helix domain-containing protein n=1 Tax=Nocardioides cheoyonin TaxID=3156615 RepID=UPI0032B5ADD1
MDATHAELLRTVDLVDLGRRIAAQRKALGLSQAALGGPDITVGYVSRIEGGQRRPSADVLARLAERLGVGIDDLLLGISTREYDELRLGLDFAELALESGGAEEASTRAAQVVAQATSPGLAALRTRARYVGARAAEALGRVNDAILELEALVAELEHSTLRLEAAVALSRCYRESGDLARSVDVGEQLLRELAGSTFEDTDEAVQLAVTVAAAHFERGDTGQAVRVCRRAVERAERLASPRARASAYWNASIVEAETGSVGNAVELAERALTLLRESEASRNLGRLQLELGILQLQLDPPQVEEARRNLERAAEESSWSSASPADAARTDLALARAQLLGGDITAARDLAEQVGERLGDRLPLLAAEARCLQGQAHIAVHEPELARTAYQQAVVLLSGLGADRAAGQLWYELADMLEQIGEYDAARDAYRSAAASTGLRRLPSIAAVSSRSAAPAV